MYTDKDMHTIVIIFRHAYYCTVYQYLPSDRHGPGQTVRLSAQEIIVR